MKLAFSAMKDEGPDVLEWVCYQRAVGFDEVLVYTNDCTDGSDDLLDALRSRPGNETAGSELPPGGGWLYCEVGGETVEAAQARAQQLEGIVESSGRAEVQGAVVVVEASTAQSTRVRPVRMRKTSSRLDRRTMDETGCSPRACTASRVPSPWSV